MDEVAQRRRVGAGMILVLGAAVTAVLATSGRPIGPGRTIYVDFDQIGDLKEGSLLKIAGRDAGVVRGFRFGAGGLVRAEVFVRSAFTRHVFRHSELFINAKGVIGERFLEVGPARGVERGPEITEGEILRGVDPARLDRMLQHTYQNLKQITDLLREVAPLMREFLALSDNITRKMAAIEGEPGRIRRIYDRGVRGADEAARTIRAVREATDDLERVRSVAAGIEGLADRTAPDLRDVGKKVDRAMDALDRLQTIFSPAERKRLAGAFDQFSAAARAGERIVKLVDALAARVEAGDGTVGALMQDREIFDDIKVMHKIMKDKPWRIMIKPLKPTPE